MRYKEIMHYDVWRGPREGFDSPGAAKDIEEMQCVIEIIAEEAGLKGWNDLKQALEVAYNRLEDCLQGARCIEDMPGNDEDYPEDYEDFDDEGGE